MTPGGVLTGAGSSERPPGDSAHDLRPHPGDHGGADGGSGAGQHRHRHRGPGGAPRRRLPVERDPANDGGRARQVCPAGGAFLRAGRQPDERRRRDGTHFHLRPCPVQPHPRRSRPGQRRGQHDLRRHVGGGTGGPCRSRRGGDAGHAPKRLSGRYLGRGNAGLLHHRADHSAIHRIDRLRTGHGHIGGAAVPGRHPAGPGDRGDHHGLHLGLGSAAPYRLGPAGAFPPGRSLAGPQGRRAGPAVAGADHRGADHRRDHAHRGGRAGRRLCPAGGDHLSGADLAAAAGTASSSPSKPPPSSCTSSPCPWSWAG